jgi:phenylphosphate carboxylase alpha subunit
MPFKDIREFIAKLEKEGEAQRIEEEVDWNLEAGAMLRRSGEVGLPAPFFQKVKDYPEGYRLLGGTATKFSRIAIAMDMSPNTHPNKLMEEFIRRKQQPIEPVLVNDGPCKENIHLGDQADLLEFPVPFVHKGDGGRYIGTWHLTICKDLDSDWVNWSIQRHMIHNSHSCGILAVPETHLGAIYTRFYEPKNRPMEVAIAIGPEPVSALCAASTAIPYGVSEVNIAGGIRGAPVELIRCETVNLAVPATAEIVIEGEIRPHERIDEGPFGEWAGYVASVVVPRPVIHVKAITHRNNPILTMACPGTPYSDDLAMAFGKAVLFSETLKANALPVTSVCVPFETCSLFAVVAVKTIYANIADDIAHVLWGTRPGYFTPYIVVVNDDVDPFNLVQWLHALASKCHPSRGIVKMEHGRVSGLIPFLNHHERTHRIGAKTYFDCTWPLDWDPKDVPARSSFTDIYPIEVQRKALAKWSKYGY